MLAEFCLTPITASKPAMIVRMPYGFTGSRESIRPYASKPSAYRVRIPASRHAAIKASPGTHQFRGTTQPFGEDCSRPLPQSRISATAAPDSDGRTARARKGARAGRDRIAPSAQSRAGGGTQLALATAQSSGANGQRFEPLALPDAFAEQSETQQRAAHQNHCGRLGC